MYFFRGKVKRRPSSSFGASIRSHSPGRLRLLDLYSFLEANFPAKTLMVTVCDKGYIATFRRFYELNHFETYSNFLAFVMDEAGYEVLPPTAPHA